MLARYVWADLVRNPRRTAASVIGVVLGVGLFSAVLFFVDGLSSSMTQRALEPLPIDMQRILTDTAGSQLTLHQEVVEDGARRPGNRARVELRLDNPGATSVNDVVLRSRVRGADYVVGSARLDGAPVPDASEGNPFASGPAQAGLGVGELSPGARLTATFEVELTGPATATAGLVRSEWSSRETTSPVPADAPPPVAIDELASRIGSIDGVAVAEPLSFVDLAPGMVARSGDGASTGSGASRSSRDPSGAATAQLTRLFGFDRAYAAADDTVQVRDGAFPSRGGAMVSIEMASAFGLRPGDAVEVALPDGSAVPLRVDGTADLSRARSLFASRRGVDLEAFIYVPSSIVVDRATYDERVAPAFDRAAAARSTQLLAPPTNEIDVRVDRSRLSGDPSTALEESARIGAAVQAVAASQDYLLDNVSNTLGVAADDARVAKQLFVFLGVPGALLAAALAAYAGNVLAAQQRREQAVLRIRGASGRDLRRMLSLHVTAVVTAGSVLGLVVGYLAARTVLGSELLHRASSAALGRSALLGALAGLVATGAALYVTGHGAIGREIQRDRSRLDDRTPLWRRAHLDVVAVVVVVGGTVVALSRGAFEGRSGSVYEGVGVDLAVGLLALPLLVWVAGALLTARLGARFLMLPRRRDRAAVGVLGTAALLRRSTGRRPWAVAQAAMVIGLVVAFAVSLTTFTASYDASKQADARYRLGADLRITPDPGDADPAPVELDGVAGIDSATVDSAVHNVVLQSDRTEELATAAAIEPSAFASVAPLDGTTFRPSGALGMLDGHSDRALLSREMAEFLQVEPGGRLGLLLERGTALQTPVQVVVVGTFDRLPGFPDGVDVVIPVDTRTAAGLERGSPATLVAVRDPADGALERTVAAVRSRLPTGARVESRADVFGRDQSSLAGLNLQGLVSLDRAFALAMCLAAVAVFVFGLLLHRRREYVALRARGIGHGPVRRLISGEAGIAGAIAVAAGTLVGAVMGRYFVAVLRPLFVLRPTVTASAVDLAVTAGLVAIAVLVCAAVAARMVAGLRADELLRDE